MKRVLFAFIVACAAGVMAADVSMSPAEIAKRRAAVQKKNGGRVVKPGSFKGAIAVVNAQSRLAESVVLGAVEELDNGTRFVFNYSKAKPSTDFAAMKTASKADFAIIVTDDATTPSLLLAPDERWAAVNVAKLDAGLKTDAMKARFMPNRGKRQIIRAFLTLCGGVSSMYPGNAVNASKVEDLDLLSGTLPMDKVQSCTTFLKNAGLSPKIVASYKIACIEKWAPAPTNDIQKAVWAWVEQNRAKHEKKDNQ